MRIQFRDNRDEIAGSERLGDATRRPQRATLVDDAVIQSLS
jgi:hypothetical protein